MAPSRGKTPRPFENLFEYESFLTILRYYVDLNCFVISSDPNTGGKDWLAVHYHSRPASLFDFEKKYKFTFNWDKLTDRAYEKSVPAGEPLLLETFGFYDLFAPIRRKGKRLGTILTGAFADQEITYPHLRAGWEKLTGKGASAENPEFRQFVRVMLETPVLEAESLKAYGEAVGLFAQVLVRQNRPGVSQRLQELLTTVFSKRFSHSYFMDWALGLPTRQATPLWNQDVAKWDWVQTDIGVSRVPTTVMTVIPQNSLGKKRDPVEEMLRVYRFQRQSFRFAQTLGQTVGGKLENYGAVFVTSADPAQGGLHRRRQIQETAERIQRFAVEALEGPALVGIGETVAPGESLEESYRQAVLALHVGRGEEKQTVFLAPARPEKAEGVLELRRLLLELKERVEKASLANPEEILDGFLHQVLNLSFQNPEEIRWHLQYGLIQLGESVRNRTDLLEKESSQFVEGLILSLEKSGTTQEMVAAFKDALEKILDLIHGRNQPQTVFSIEKIRGHLDARFRGPVKISRLAKMAEVSISTLSRRFKKTTGVGLKTYVQKLRLDEARQMLKTGNLPVTQIAKACGFKSGSYFTRLFRRQMRMSPQEFRKKTRAHY